MSKPKKYRSAVTGQYISESEAKKKPRESVAETPSKRRKRSK